MSSPHRPRRTTIHDVARVAGVSHQTVSNVVHSTGRVGDRTRERVQQAVRELGYRPHSGAASLRTARSYRLAHPITTGELRIGNAIMLEFVAALAAAAGRVDHHLLLTTSGDGGLDDIAQLAGSGAIDAVVLADVAAHDPRVTSLAAAGVPFACFGRTEADQPQSWVDVDNRAGLLAATEHVLERGHRRVAFLGYDAQGRWDVEREAGYREAMRAAGLAPLVRTTALAADDVQRTLGDLFDRGDRPTAVVTGSDELAAAVYTGALRRGLTIGTDLAVTGFDGSDVGRSLIPTLTTVRIPVARVTELLVERALAEFAGPTGRPGELLVPELVVGTVLDALPRVTVALSGRWEFTVCRPADGGRPPLEAFVTTSRAAAVLVSMATAVSLAACSSSGSSGVSQSQLEAKLRKESSITALTKSGEVKAAGVDKLVECASKALIKDADPSQLQDYVDGKIGINKVKPKSSDAKDDAKTAVTACVKSAVKAGS